MKLNIIPLRITRYSDTKSILSALSAELGRVALTVPSGSGRNSARLRALTMPLNLLECETAQRPGQDILPIREVTPARIHMNLHSDPVKQMLTLFTAEVIDTFLRDSGPNLEIFAFTSLWASWLDSASPSATANLHLLFLSGLGRLLGIAPDVSTYAPGRILDMRGGIWRDSPPLHPDWLTVEESLAAWHFMRLTERNASTFRYNRAQRNRALDIALRYFAIHHFPAASLKSLDVLRQML